MSFLNGTMNNKQWFVRACDVLAPQASQCEDCFYIYNLRSLYYQGSYHLFVAAVDTTAKPNQAVVNKDWIPLARSSNQDMDQFVHDAFESDCVYGITATNLWAN